MDEILKYLKEGALGAFATVDDGKPEVRPWQFQFAENGKFYFCTTNNKPVYNQLKKTPFAAFSTTTSEMATVRLAGEVTFINDIDLKRKMLDKQPGLKAMFQSADNPILELFYIEHGQASITASPAQPPKKITF